MHDISLSIFICMYLAQGRIRVENGWVCVECRLIMGGGVVIDFYWSLSKTENKTKGGNSAALIKKGRYYIWHAHLLIVNILEAFEFSI